MGLQSITSSRFHFWIRFLLTIIVVTGVVEGPSTLTLEKIWYCTCEMKNLGTPETHPEELVVFKNERQYYKICLFLDNFTTRSSSGWVLAIPKIYISKNISFQLSMIVSGVLWCIPNQTIYLQCDNELCLISIHRVISSKWR